MFVIFDKGTTYEYNAHNWDQLMPGQQSVTQTGRTKTGALPEEAAQAPQEQLVRKSTKERMTEVLSSGDFPDEPEEEEE